MNFKEVWGNKLSVNVTGTELFLYFVSKRKLSNKESKMIAFT